MTIRFGIITDTHIRPQSGDQSSPYAVNARANGRAAYAAALLAAQRTEFDIHLGDVVHPLPHLPTFGPACEEARNLLAPLGDGLRFVPGNHDIGDKPHPGSPAGPVTEQSEAAYRSRIGEPWYVFDHGGVHFVVMNSSLVNAGTRSEARQREWLERTLRERAGERLFLFSHYPLFIDHADEPEHYDNYAEPGRSWLLDLAAVTAVEAVFSGHVHHFFYNRHNGVKFYTIPATSFTRQDFAELFPVGPAPEFGRDDRGKFMVCVVTVDDAGHRLQFLDTGGCEDGAPIDAFKQVPENALTPYLRHSWARSVDLPYQGPMEEFSRKRARNDYPLLRLWQMGIATVRTPLADLMDAQTRARMCDWHAVGIRFSLVSSRPPGEAERAMLVDNADMISALEIAVAGGPAGTIAMPGGLPIRIGRIRSSADGPAQGSKFAHTVSFGYLASELDKVQEKIAAIPGLGATFQIAASEDIGTIGERIASFARETARPVGVAVRISLDDPSVPQTDLDWSAARVREALALSRRHPEIDVSIDTFCEVDRGYHPRAGLVDRLCNLTIAGRELCYGGPETDR